MGAASDPQHRPRPPARGEQTLRSRCLRGGRGAIKRQAPEATAPRSRRHRQLLWRRLREVPRSLARADMAGETAERQLGRAPRR